MSKNVKRFRDEIQSLKQRLEEAEDTIAAIRTGSVDAFVVQDGEGPRVFTLETADRPYRIFVEQMQQGAATLLPNGAIAYSNRRLAELLQVPHEKLIGAALSDFVPVNGRAGFEALLREAHRGTVQGEIHFLKADASLIPTYLTIHPLAGPGPTSLCVLITDLTAAKFEADRRRTEEALRHNQQQMQLISDSVPVLISYVDSERRYRFCNKVYTRWFGLPRTEIIGKHVREVLGDQVWRVIEPHLNLAFAGQTVTFEAEAAYARGGNRWIYAVYTPDRDRDGNVCGLVKMEQDISARKQAEESLRQRTAQFETLLNQSPLGMYVVDADFRIREVNPIALPVFGDIPDLIGRDFDEVIHIIWPKAFADEIVRSFRHTLETGEPSVTPERIEKRLDRGVTEYYEWQIHRIPFEEGRFGVVCYFRDIAAQVQAREMIAESELKFRQVANTMPQFVWTARPDGYIDYYNERWYEFTGFPRDQFGQGSWEPILHPDDLQRCVETYYEAIRSGQPYQIEYRFKDRATGGYRWFMGRALPVRNERGEITRWFGTWTDIDDQKRAEERLESVVAERTTKLRELVNELQHVSYAITHDMRAPLRAMGLFAQMLMEESAQASPQVQDYCQRILTGASRLDKLIHDALGYTKAVLQELPLEPVDLSTLIRGLVETYPNLQSEKADIQIEGNLPTVLGNEALLTQCFSNLLGNAVKFVAPGTRPKVRVWSETAANTARIWIEDNGIGIPKHAQSRLFGMFQKLDAQYEGTGIGLAIVRKVAERMGGKVGVESEPGRGSRFWVMLQRSVASPVA